MRLATLCTLALAAALALPGNATVAKAGNDNKIRIATLAPRSSDLVKGFARIDKALKDSTKGQWAIQLYPSGIAGDEKDVIRKMRVGQMDGTAVTSVGLSQVLRELAVLTAPGAIETYAQLEAVQKSLNEEWEKKLGDAGFKMLGWGEVGMLRYFTKAPIRKPSDLKSQRPWVWPESHTMKAMWQAVGCTGVPLGVPEVYGALQTGMVDSIITTSLAAVALQWHTKLDHVTKRTHGPLVAGLVISNEKWNSIPEDIRGTIYTQIRGAYEDDSKQIRKDDDSAFKRLQTRGYTAVEYSAEGEKELEMFSQKARDSLVGRVYSKELLDRVLSFKK